MPRRLEPRHRCILVDRRLLWAVQIEQTPEQRAGEYKQISSKSFHGELSFVKNSVNNLLRELKPVNFHLAFPMGLSCHRIARFSIRGSAVIYNSQIAFNGCPLARRRCRRGGIVAVAVV